MGHLIPDIRHINRAFVLIRSRHGLQVFGRTPDLFTQNNVIWRSATGILSIPGSRHNISSSFFFHRCLEILSLRFEPAYTRDVKNAQDSVIVALSSGRDNNDVRNSFPHADLINCHQLSSIASVSPAVR